MSLERVLLGLLVQQPSHGYRLWQRINAVLGALRPIQAAHVYETLAALERKGLLLARTKPDARGGSRRVFRPTASGHAAHRSWLASSAGGRTLLRRPLLVKAAVAMHLGERFTSRLVRAERESREHLLRFLREPKPGSPVARLLRERAAHHLEVELWLLDQLASVPEPTTRRSASGSR